MLLLLLVLLAEDDGWLLELLAEAAGWFAEELAEVEAWLVEALLLDAEPWLVEAVLPEAEPWLVEAMLPEAEPWLVEAVLPEAEPWLVLAEELWPALEPSDADDEPACPHCCIAACVRGPMMPSIGPGSQPLSFRACCCWRTSSEPCEAPLADALSEADAPLPDDDEARLPEVDPLPEAAPLPELDPWLVEAESEPCPEAEDEPGAEALDDALPDDCAMLWPEDPACVLWMEGLDELSEADCLCLSPPANAADTDKANAAMANCCSFMCEFLSWIGHGRQRIPRLPRRAFEERVNAPGGSTGANAVPHMRTRTATRVCAASCIFRAMRQPNARSVACVPTPLRIWRRP
ncbi:MAG TPA: hypothetical protein VEC19_06735 [Usitatibacter sp.]|nr:hypothetical protein [Usitatibacter sp.]